MSALHFKLSYVILYCHQTVFPRLQLCSESAVSESVSSPAWYGHSVVQPHRDLLQGCKLSFSCKTTHLYPKFVLMTGIWIIIKWYKCSLLRDDSEFDQAIIWLEENVGVYVYVHHDSYINQHFIKWTLSTQR